MTTQHLRKTILFMMLAMCMNVAAQKVKVGMITYKIENGEAYVYGADKKIVDANILASVEYKGKTYPVTKIGNENSDWFKVFWGRVYAFANCNQLKSVTIPNSVKTIGSGAFYKCSSLTSVSIPNSVVSIGTCAFCECSSLTSVSIPNSVTTIDKETFLGCSNLTTISIPNSVTSIGHQAFYGCPLRCITVPDNIISIAVKEGNFVGAFATCNQISEVKSQNGSTPLWMIPFLPETCPFVVAQKYQQPNNNGNMYAQNVPQQAPAQSQPQPAVAKKAKKPSSDVDVNLPTNTTTNENTFAVIFANENYQEEVNVEYALNDGEMFSEYCHKVLGLPEENIHIRKDATRNNIIAEVAWMQQVAEAYDGQARFIVYYAGHGIPDEKLATAYLLPVDGKGSMLETGYSLQDFYKVLGAMPSQGVTVFMDACFSGSRRGEGMLASARGVAIKSKTQVPQGKMVVFSASQGDETAYPLKDKGHGLFTYFLLKKLKETKGNVTYGELGNYLQTEVKRKSIVSNSKSQTPTVTPSESVAATWQSMKLR